VNGWFGRGVEVVIGGRGWGVGGSEMAGQGLDRREAKANCQEINGVEFGSGVP
jgi:hypothetical protein